MNIESRKNAIVIAGAVVMGLMLVGNPLGVVFAQATPTFQDLEDSRIENISFTIAPQIYAPAIPIRQVISLPEDLKNREILITVPAELNLEADKTRIDQVVTELYSRTAALSPKESKARTLAIPAQPDQEQQADLPITKKLAILADAIFEGQIKGLAGLRHDEFTDEFLLAIAIELTEWLEAVETDQEFQNIFTKKGPWILVLTAMSPTSMHEYADNLDLPGLGGGLEAQRLPVNAYVTPKGDNLEVELVADYDLSITFRINSQNQIEVVNA